MFTDGNPISSILCFVFGAATLVLFARAICSWFPTPPSGPLRMIFTGLVTITEPVLKPLRSAIPPLRMGAFRLDISIIVAFVVLLVLRQAIC